MLGGVWCAVAAAIGAAGTPATLVLVAAIPIRSGLAAKATKATFPGKMPCKLHGHFLYCWCGLEIPRTGVRGGHAPACTGASAVIPAAASLPCTYSLKIWR